MAAGEIARRLDVRQTTMSDHLQILARAQILIPERRSQLVIYSVNPGVLAKLLSFLGNELKVRVDGGKVRSE